MMQGVLTLSAAAALLELDAVQVGQFTLSRPTVAGALFGVIGGDFITGLQLGLSMELMNLDQMPVGGYVPPDGVLGAACAFSLCRYFGFDSGYAFFVGFVLAKLFSPIEMKMRSARSLWNTDMALKVEENPCVLNRWLLRGMSQQVIVSFIFTVAAVYAAGNICGVGWLFLPLKLRPAFAISFRLVPWLGLAALTASLFPRKGT